MNPIPPTIQEPVRVFPDDPRVDENQEVQISPEPSIPYGWEDTKDWSWR
jgi:hypothetical protein